MKKTLVLLTVIVGILCVSTLYMHSVVLADDKSATETYDIPKEKPLVYTFWPCGKTNGVHTCMPIEVHGEKATAEDFKIRNKNASPYSIYMIYENESAHSGNFVSHLMYAIEEAEKNGFMASYVVVK